MARHDEALAGLTRTAELGPASPLIDFSQLVALLLMRIMHITGFGWDCNFNGVTPETEETPDD
jgi:hypothetical protein